MKVEFNEEGLPVAAYGKQIVVLSKGKNPDAPQQAPQTTQIFDKTSIGDLTYINWGTNNNLPIEQNTLIEENAILTRALSMNIAIAAGNGLVPVRVKGYDGAGKESLEFVNDADLIAILNQSWIYNYIYEALRDRAKFGNAFVQLRPNLTGDKIIKLTCANAIYNRVALPGTTGVPETVLYSGKFPDNSEDSLYSYPLLNPYDPEQHLFEMQAKGSFKKSIFFQIKNKFSNEPWYAMPNWYAAYEWVQISNKIPKFIDGGLNNMLNVTTIIRIPYSYWEFKYPKEQFENNIKKRKELIQADIDSLETNMTGPDNAKKTLINFFGSDEANPEADKWEIEILQPKNDASNIMNATAADSYIAISAELNPDVLGLMYGNSKGGSMQRELLILHEILSAPARREVLEPLKLMLNFNYGTKYADVELRFKQDFLTTLDTGKQTGTTLN